MRNEMVELAQQLLDSQPFSVLLGTRVAAFVPGDVTVRLPLRPDHTQQEGRVHNAVIAALAETALIFAGGSALGVPVVTAAYTINYVQPAAGAALVAQAQALTTEGGRGGGGGRCAAARGASRRHRARRCWWRRHRARLSRAVTRRGHEAARAVGGQHTGRQTWSAAPLLFGGGRMSKK